MAGNNKLQLTKYADDATTHEIAGLWPCMWPYAHHQVI